MQIKNKLNLGIGWDIGIKNLAYCILEHIPSNVSGDIETEDTIQINNNTYRIHNWQDINLVSQIELNLETAGEVSHINTNLKCSVKGDKINAPICGNNAFYCSETVNQDGTYKGYCKIHYKKLFAGVNMPEISVKKCYVSSCDAKVSQVLKEHKYIGYCKKHINEMIKSQNKTISDFLKINRAKTTAKIDINHLGISLFQELDKINKDIMEPSIILLENQPVLKNPTMKSMQMFLYSYYLLRHLDKINTTTNMNATMGNTNILKSINLQCYTASKKLDMIQFFPVEEQERIKLNLECVKNNYQKNKKQSIMMVEYLLENTINANSKWLNFFRKHPKQDDLADALLMTLHYFEKNNLNKIKTLAKKKKDNDKKIE
jgi:hypothetical protein